jgi:hypothetical protein
MLVQKNICSSFFFTLLTISTMFIASPSTIFGVDTTIYDPAKGYWHGIGAQCPEGAAGPATEPINPSNTLSVARIYMQYKIIQTYAECYAQSGCCYKTAASCQDGSCVPETACTESDYRCMKSNVQCVEFPDLATHQGKYPIYYQCSQDAENRWGYDVRAFCSSSLDAYEWRLKDEPDPASNFGDPACN